MNRAKRERLGREKFCGPKSIRE
jgi:hypothetical protein